MPTNREIYFQLNKENNKYLTRLVIKSLLSDANGFSGDIDLYKNFDLDIPNYEEFLKKVDRVRNGEPYQYVLGYSNFIDMLFEVNSNVLIPRQETEELVIKTKALIENYFDLEKPINIADICTGSGAIGITLKKYFPNANVYATDISEEAIKIASKNATKFGCPVKFELSNLADSLIKENVKIDVLICNPPYIENESMIDEQVWKFEPHLALLAKPSTKFYEEIFKAIPDLVNPKSLLAFEIGEDMVDALDELICKYIPGYSYYFLKDMYNKYRFLFIILDGDNKNA